jgi:hypothetical protein
LWRQFANKLIDIEVIGEGGWMLVDGKWDELRGINTDGAILVRPDGVVGWMTVDWKDELVISFEGIFGNILRLSLYKELSRMTQPISIAV